MQTGGSCMKVLVIHATAGAGHKKAAEAVFNTIKAHTNYDVQCQDALDYTNAFYCKAYREGYKYLITHFSWLWGFFFWLIDIRFLLPVVRLSRRVLNTFNARKLHDFLQDQKFDCIITSHFFPLEVACFLKRKGLIRSKIICVVTDYDAHSIWSDKGVDHYAVACEQTKNTLVSLGVAPDNIVITGIPTDEKFTKIYDRDALYESLGLNKDLFTVLIATGSFGIGPIEEIIGYLKGVQSVVVCGHNQKLFKTLSSKNQPFVKVCGFVNNMHEYMAVSDAMITKPGGLSISEALVSCLALLFFSAIPGQETNNIKVLKQYGIGVSNISPLEMAQEIKTLNNSLEYRAAVQAKIKQLACPNAAADIMKLIA